MSKLNDAPLVSVVTAAFNARAGLQATVESVASQGFRSVEHIVIDGGSTDGTREYLESLGDAVRWVSEPDGGIADALNKGIAMARGEYVLVLQAEDTFRDEGSLGRAERYLDEGKDIVAFEVVLVRDGGRTERRRSHGLGIRTEFKMTNPHQGMFCRRDLFERIGAFDPSYRIAMDYEFLLRAKRNGVKLRAVSEVVSIMPATGVSTEVDWPAVEARLREDQRLQRQHSSGGAARLFTELFWFAYMPFKRIKHGDFRG